MVRAKAAGPKRRPVPAPAAAAAAAGVLVRSPDSGFGSPPGAAAGAADAGVGGSPWSPGARSAGGSAREGAGGARGSGAVPGVRRDGKRRAGVRPLDREIRRLQADHHYLSFPKMAFARLVKDIQMHFSEEPFRWTGEALLLFQSAAEEYLMYLYADAYLATHHRHRVTLNTEDLRLVRRLRQPHCWGETI